MARLPLDDLGSSIDGMVREVRKARFTASRAGAEAIRKELLAAFRAAGRDRFRGAKVGVEIKQLSRSNGYVVGRAGRSAGAIAIGDAGTKPHDIKPRRGKALLLPNGFSGPVRHPGARGTGMWSKGLKAGDAAADTAVFAVLDDAGDKGF